MFELHSYAKLCSTILQNVQQTLASQSTKTMATGSDYLTPVMHVNVVPVGKLVLDLFCTQGIIGFQSLHSLI